MSNKYSSLGGNADEGFFHKYKKPLIFLVSAATVVGIILIIVFLLLDHTGRPAEDGIEKYDFNLESIFNSSLDPKSYSLKWAPGGAAYLAQDPETKDWYRHEVESNSSSLFLNVSHIKERVPGYSSFIFSPDQTLLLVAFNVSSVWRYSTKASYAVYNILTQEVYPLVAGNPQLQNVVWNPVNHQVVYVEDYNIYIVDASSSSSILSASPISVTDDGDAEKAISNGIQSWVYEEEIFSSFNALWWSADGKYLSYLKSDESSVPIFDYALFEDTPYPTQVPLRYPKPGYPNPEVSLHIYDVANSSSNATSSSSSLIEFGAGNEYEYISDVQWKNDNTLWIQTLNRFQNVSSIVVLSLSPSSSTWEESIVFTQSSTKWVVIKPLVFCNNYNLAILPNGDNLHLANLQLSNNAQPTFLTKGSFDVISVAGCLANKIVYHATPEYTATNPVAATLQHIYGLSTNGDDVITQIGNSAGFYSATSFSPLGNYFVVNYQGPDVPRTFLVDGSNVTRNSTLQDNKAYAETITHYNFPVKKFTTVKGETGDVLNAYYKRPFAESSSDKELPLVLFVYAGPGSNRVLQTHKLGGLEAWLGYQGYGVAFIDGRGTGRRGLTFLQSTYKQLGLLEIADQRAGVKDLCKKGNFDEKRVVIYGWSYGGFMAAHAIAKTSAIDGFEFRGAISGAPVTDWRFYDSVYTERFMSTPEDNPAGYNSTSVLQYAKNIPDDSLLLVHGTGDDNVHFQNTVELTSSLINNGIQFETQFFPNENHSFDNNALRYLYTKMAAFLGRVL